MFWIFLALLNLHIQLFAVQEINVTEASYYRTDFRYSAAQATHFLIVTFYDKNDELLQTIDMALQYHSDTSENKVKFYSSLNSCLDESQKPKPSKIIFDRENGIRVLNKRNEQIKRFSNLSITPETLNKSELATKYDLSAAQIEIQKPESFWYYFFSCFR